MTVWGLGRPGHQLSHLPRQVRSTGRCPVKGVMHIAFFQQAANGKLCFELSFLPGNSADLLEQQEGVCNRSFYLEYSPCPSLPRVVYFFIFSSTSYLPPQNFFLKSRQMDGITWRTSSYGWKTSYSVVTKL